MTKRLQLSPSAWIGASMIAFYVLFGIVGPWLAPFSPTHQDLAARFQHASSTHWFGTGVSGIDTFSQLLWGGREALIISFVVVAITSVTGVVIGTLAGWFGGAVDEVIMRIVDILMAFPGILLNIAVVATVAHPGLGVIIFALCINGWVSYARVARSQVLALREREYVTAALALGASNRRVMFVHLIPNLLGPAFVQMSFGLGSVIAIEAALSFLGLGPQLEYTWGAMLAQGTMYAIKPGFAHFILYPGAAIAWVLLGANLLGDGLRDRFDPRHRSR